MDIAIRAATIEDFDAIGVLFAQVNHIHAAALPALFRSTPAHSRDSEIMQHMIDDPDTHVWVAEQNGAVVAFASAEIRHPRDIPILMPLTRIYISDVVVDERRRGTGIGAALLAHIEAWARSLGIRRIELTVWEFNSTARAAYEHQGYSTLNRTMSKDLDE
jgi:GNAT superfamily N-acetyltransferase